MTGSHPVTFPQPPKIKDHRQRARTVRELIQHFVFMCVCARVCESGRCNEVRAGDVDKKSKRQSEGGL